MSYLVALALFAGGAYVFGAHVASCLAGAERPPAGPREVLELVVKGTPGSPTWQLAVGAALAAVGLLVARPVASITFGVRKPRAERSVRSLVHDLGSPDAAVRLEAAKALAELAEPGSIPALIRALRDPVPKVRGQACEALLGMTGLDFDFVDVASESVREASVKQWEAWWAANKAKILAGADPKTVGAGPAPGGGGAPAQATPRPSSRVAAGSGAVRRTTPVTPSGRVSPVPGSTRAVARATPAPTEARDVGLGELIRRKRERDKTPPPGGAWLEEPAPEEPETEAAADSAPPASLSAGEEKPAEKDAELPPTGEELPPPPP